jgi:putative ABC transport system ATP-binding protein
MQKKTASPTRKLPIRVASKEDIFSTTYLLPSVREIFTLTSGNEQAASPPNTSPVAFVKPQTMSTSAKFDHRAAATHKELLKKYVLVPGDANSHALVLDRNPVTTPSHVPHRTKDGDSSLFEEQSRTLIDRQELVEVSEYPIEQTTWNNRQEEFLPATSNQHVVMDVRSITKSLPLGREHIEVLKGISFQIRSGEFVTIVGPSGSGKSTLLGIIAGLDSPTSGQVLIDGVDIANLPEEELAKVRNQKIGMVFQAFNLLPTLTALENVEAPLQVGRRKGSPATRAKELLALVGLPHRLHHRPSQLSGGEQQRVAIARALATDPPIVIADEPTGNLDARNGENVLQLITDLRAQTGKTFIIATHDPTVAAHADRVIRVLDGRVAGQAQGTAPTTTGGRITQ